LTRHDEKFVKIRIH